VYSRYYIGVGVVPEVDNVELEAVLLLALRSRYLILVHFSAIWGRKAGIPFLA
jgi:hypothetical protein